MLFLIVSDTLEPRVIQAATLRAAAGAVLADFRERLLAGETVGPVHLAAVIPDLGGTIQADPTDPSGVSFRSDSDAATANQSQLLDAADQALVNNHAYLGLANPTNAQAVAQVAALTRQVDALIRLAVGDFGGTN